MYKGTQIQQTKTIPINNRSESITIVTGYPRSGTSMIMQALHAGGMPILRDGVNPPDRHNPKGYYEFKPALNLNEEEKSYNWVPKARGQAVKVLAYQLRYLPDNQEYKVIFMRRKIKELLSSMEKMGLVRENLELNERQQELAFKGEYVHYEIWLEQQAHMQAIYLNYNQVLAAPVEKLTKVKAFLAMPLEVEKMAAAVDPALYRNRA